MVELLTFPSKRIAIVGTRSRDTSEAFNCIQKMFWKIYNEGDWIVTGGCPKGGDRFAYLLAKQEGIPLLTFYPNYKRYKLGAPIIRNGIVAENSDVVIACVQRPEEGLEMVLNRIRGGTEDMLKKFVNLHPNGKVYLI